MFSVNKKIKWNLKGLLHILFFNFHLFFISDIFQSIVQLCMNCSLVCVWGWTFWLLCLLIFCCINNLSAHSHINQFWVGGGLLRVGVCFMAELQSCDSVTKIIVLINSRWVPDGGIYTWLVRKITLLITYYYFSDY